MRKNILFILHRLYYEGKTKEGGVDFFIRYYKSKGYNVHLIEHTLEDLTYPSKYIVNGKTKRIFHLKSGTPMRWIKEYFINKKIVKDADTNFEEVYASDALNVISAYWVKKKGYAKKVKFHCTDFSKTRFKNPILNSIYLNVFKFSLNNADETNVVTPYVEKMAREFAPKANIRFIPNSPIYKTFPRIEPDKKNVNNLVITISQMSKKSNFDNYVKIIEEVKKDIPKINLKIIGSCDEYAKRLIRDKKLEKNIVYTGLMPYNEAIKELASGYIGIVFYPRNIDHVKYGDSIKLREYAASGLPSVSDDITFTSKEMIDHNAGLVAETTHEMAKNIINLIKNKEKYLKMRENALSWAREMDKEKILSKMN